MPVTCPFCRSSGSRLISQFGSQLLFSQYRCSTCGSYFEGLREDGSENSSSVTDFEGNDDGSRIDEH